MSATTATVLLTLSLVGETLIAVKPAEQLSNVYRSDVIKQCQYMAKESDINPYKVLTTYVPKDYKCERTIKL